MCIRSRDMNEYNRWRKSDDNEKKIEKRLAELMSEIV